MEDAHVTQQTPQKSGSGFWVGFWLSLLMLGAIAGAGVYLDYRLAQFETRLASQRAEIIQNREEAAELAGRFTETFDALSTMLTSTVDSFTQHTQKLATVIESKEKSQSEYLRTAIEELNERIKAENESLRTSIAALSTELGEAKLALGEVKKDAGQTRQEVIEASQTLDKLQKSVNDDLSNLTQLANAMGESVKARFEAQSSEFASKLNALDEASQRSLQKLGKQVNDLHIQQRETGSQVASMASGMAGLNESQSELNDSIKQETRAVSGSVTQLQEDLQALAGNLEIGFAASNERAEVLRSDLAEIGYSLTQRTEDLLVQLIDAQKAAQADSADAEQIRSALESYANDVTGFMENFSSEISTLNDSVKSLTERIAAAKSESVAANTTISETVAENEDAQVSQKSYSEATATVQNTPTADTK